MTKSARIGLCCFAAAIFIALPSSWGQEGELCDIESAESKFFIFILLGDSDGDGMLSQDEVEAGIGVDPGTFDTYWPQFDGDGNGEATLREFENAAPILLFVRVDTDLNNEISLAEAQELSEDVTEAQFNEVDYNGNGVIDCMDLFNRGEGELEGLWLLDDQWVIEVQNVVDHPSTLLLHELDYVDSAIETRMRADTRIAPNMLLATIESVADPESGGLQPCAENDCTDDIAFLLNETLTITDSFNDFVPEGVYAATTPEALADLLNPPEEGQAEEGAATVDGEQSDGEAAEGEAQGEAEPDGEAGEEGEAAEGEAQDEAEPEGEAGEDGEAGDGEAQEEGEPEGEGGEEGEGEATTEGEAEPAIEGEGPSEGEAPSDGEPAEGEVGEDGEPAADGEAPEGEPENVLIIDLQGGGTVDPVPGSYAHSAGEEVDLTATPEEDWVFDHWAGVEAEDARKKEITVTVEGRVYVRAVFRGAPKLFLSCSAAPGAQGAGLGDAVLVALLGMALASGLFAKPKTQHR